MAISKRIELGNGIVTNYHRIVSVNVITNVQNVIEVASYTSRAKRKEETDWYAESAYRDELSLMEDIPEEGWEFLQSEQEPMNVFIETTVLTAPYDQDMSVAGAYEWLKTTELFEGANDAQDF